MMIFAYQNMKLDVNKITLILNILTSICNQLLHLQFSIICLRHYTQQDTKNKDTLYVYNHSTDWFNLAAVIMLQ
jgi:hypothetical protein